MALADAAVLGSLARRTPVIAGDGARAQGPAAAPQCLWQAAARVDMIFPGSWRFSPAASGRLQ